MTSLYLTLYTCVCVYVYVYIQVLQKLDPYYRTPGTDTLLPILNTDVLAELSCSSTKDRIILDLRDTITKNMLLHIPYNNIRYDNMITDISGDSSNVCGYSHVCIDNCSNQGMCLSAHPYSTTTTTSASASTTSASSSTTVSTPNVTPVSTSSKCYCEKGFYGDNCGHNSDPSCTTPGHAGIQVNMFDSFGTYLTLPLPDPDLITPNRDLILTLH